MVCSRPRWARRDRVRVTGLVARLGWVALDRNRYSSDQGQTQLALVCTGLTRTQNPTVSWLPEPSSSSSPPNIIMSDSVLPGIPGSDPHNLQPWTVAVVVSVTVLATVAVALRLFSRYLKAQKLWWDDYMIIFSQVCRPRCCWGFLSPRESPLC